MNNSQRVFTKQKVINLNSSGIKLSTGSVVPLSHIGLIPELKEYPLSVVERTELAAITIRQTAIGANAYDDSWYSQVIEKLYCPLCKAPQPRPCKFKAFDYFTIQTNRPICFRE